MTRLVVVTLVAVHLVGLAWALRRGARDDDRAWWVLGWLLLGPLVLLAGRARGAGPRRVSR